MVVALMMLCLAFLFVMLNVATTTTVVVLGQEQDKNVWNRTKYTLSNYVVAGVNLAEYGMNDAAASTTTTDKNVEPPFELFEEFDCSKIESIQDLEVANVDGDEDLNFWMVQSWFKKKLEGKSLEFYNDKVALKRWLPTVGYDIPKPFVLSYASELTSTGKIEDETDAILQLLPKGSDYVAKPSHLSRSFGVWVVSHDIESNVTSVSEKADDYLEPEEDFDAREIANNLAQNLHEYPFDLDKAAAIRGTVKPGIVVEERFTAYGYENEPALEFKMLLIWGKVFISAWRIGGYMGPWYPGVVHRNGSMVEGSANDSLPDWIDWSRVVDIAERLGANKDMFRVDLLVGVGAGSPALREEASEHERKNAVRYVVSEVSHISGEPFPDEILEESLRLWLAGYKIGNYRLVPNTEVPPEYQNHKEQKEEL